MISNMKTRWAIIFGVTLLALLSVTPNFVDVGEDWFFSKDKIIYGLDIQGGLHLVMGVDVQGVIEEKTERLSRSLADELKDQGVPFSQVSIAPDDKTRLQVGLKSPGDAASVEKYLDDFYPATLQVLDKGTDRMILRYFDATITEYKKQTIDQAIEVIRNRIDEFGVSEPSIASQGSDRILVQLPGIKDSARAKELINRTARLSFRAVSKEMEPDEVSQLVLKVEKAGNYSLGKEGLSYGDYVKRVNEDLKAELPKDTKIVFEKNEAAASLEAGKIAHLIDLESDLGGDQLEDASVRPDEFGKPEVVFRFTVDGRRKFAEITEKTAPGYLAIVLDDVVKSAPSVREKIDSATARITLGARSYQETLNEAQFIATALRAGALPATLEQLEERTVGPTLGADSIAKGKKAGIVGSILVLMFMLLYYRKLGVVADIALALNVLFVLAILTSLGATLTLPGVAGIVLTVGMAVDANVIIFERIREELRKGAGIGAAVKDGFGHAFSAIFDANITTAAVCIVLMYFGTGPVRGFAVTLLCGIATSMFTAIFVSRSIIELMINRFKVKTLV